MISLLLAVLLSGSVCPVNVVPPSFDHARHLDHLRGNFPGGHSSCIACHEAERADHGCWNRLRPGFNCRMCHLRIPGQERAR